MVLRESSPSSDFLKEAEPAASFLMSPRELISRLGFPPKVHEHATSGVGPETCFEAETPEGLLFVVSTFSYDVELTSMSPLNWHILLRKQDPLLSVLSAIGLKPDEMSWIRD